MNKYQEHYAIAKALVQAIEEEISNVEHEYIMDRGIVNPDNSIPKHIYCIEDDNLFNKANQKCSKLAAERRLEDELNKAKKNLGIAEEALIAYGISIAPVGLRDTLSKGGDANYDIRSRMIDMVFRLDITTVK